MILRRARSVKRVFNLATLFITDANCESSESTLADSTNVITLTPADSTSVIRSASYDSFSRSCLVTVSIALALVKVVRLDNR